MQVHHLSEMCRISVKININIIVLSVDQMIAFIVYMQVNSLIFMTPKQA